MSQKISDSSSSGGSLTTTQRKTCQPVSGSNSKRIEYGCVSRIALEEVVVGLAVLVGAPELRPDAGEIGHGE